MRDFAPLIERINTGKIDYYEFLGVTINATDQEIKIAARRNALLYHPDKNPKDKGSAEIIFKFLQSVLEVLSDPSTRAKYNNTLPVMSWLAKESSETKVSAESQYQADFYNDNDFFAKTPYDGWLKKEDVPTLIEMYTGGVVENKHFSLVLPKLSTGKTGCYSKWVVFDNLRVQISFSKYSSEVGKYLNTPSTDFNFTGVGISFQNCDFNASVLEVLSPLRSPHGQINMQSYNFSNSSFVGADLNNADLVGCFTGSVFDLENLSSKSFKMSLKDDELFRISHKNMLISVTTTRLMEEIKCLLGNSNEINSLKEKASRYCSYGNPCTALMLFIAQKMHEIPDFKEAWNAALDKFALQQRLEPICLNNDGDLLQITAPRKSVVEETIPQPTVTTSLLTAGASAGGQLTRPQVSVNPSVSATVAKEETPNFIARLKSHYLLQAGFFNASGGIFNTGDPQKVVQTLRDRAEKNPGGASEKTLEVFKLGK